MAIDGVGVVDLVVDLVDVDFEVDLDLDIITRQECFILLSFEKVLRNKYNMSNGLLEREF